MFIRVPKTLTPAQKKRMEYIIQSMESPPPLNKKRLRKEN